MFTFGAVILFVYIGWQVDRFSIRDRESIFPVDEDEVRQCILHTRQDVKLICFLLYGILIMMGIIADIIFFTRH